MSNKSLSKEPLCVFTCCFLKRYAELLPVDLKLQLEEWKQKICGEAVAESEAKREQRNVENFDSLIAFFGDFAGEITGLGKATLLDVAMSYRKTTSSRWHQMTNFYRRCVDNVTVEQRQLLEDWELVLCNVAKDTVVLLPGIRRCFDRACAYLEDKKDDLISLRQPTLVAALSNKSLSKEPLCVFTCCFLKRYAEQLPVDLKLQLEEWKQKICGEAVAESEAKREQRNVENFDSLIQFLGEFADEIMGLQKSTLHASHLIAAEFLLPTEQMHLSAVNKSFYERALDCWEDQTLDAGELRQLQMVYMQHLQVDFCLDASACATCNLWVEFPDSAYRSTGICSPCRRTLRDSGIAHEQKLQQCSGLNLTGLDIALEWLQISSLRKCIRFERYPDFRRACIIATGRLALSNPFR